MPLDTTAARARRFTDCGIQDGRRRRNGLASRLGCADEPAGKEKIITKETEPAPSDFYGDSKLQADLAIQKLACKDFAVAIMRPPAIYGPACKGNFPRLLKLARYAFAFPNIENRRSMIYIDNFCECVKQTIDEGKGGVYFPQNEEYVSTKDVIVQARKLKGRGTLLIPCPKLIIRVLGKNATFNKAFGSKVYDKGISECGKYNVVGFLEGLRRVVVPSER